MASLRFWSAFGLAVLLLPMVLTAIAVLPVLARPVNAGSLPGQTVLMDGGNCDDKRDSRAAMINHWRLAWYYHNEGKYQKSCDECSKALEFLQDERLYSLRADVYRHLKEHNNELNDAEKAIALGPSDAQNYSMRGWAYCMSGELKKGIADARKALSLKSSNSDAMATLGLAFFKQGHYKKALKYLDKSIEIYDKDPESHALRSLVLQKLGKEDRAAADLEKARSLHYIDKP